MRVSRMAFEANSGAKGGAGRGGAPDRGGAAQFFRPRGRDTYLVGPAILF